MYHGFSVRDGEIVLVLSRAVSLFTVSRVYSEHKLTTYGAFIYSLLSHLLHRRLRFPVLVSVARPVAHWSESYPQELPAPDCV